MELKDYIRNIQDYPKKGILFRDITTLLQNKDAFKYAIDKMAEQISSEKIDYIVGAESRGFLIGSALAYKLNCGFIPVRKKGKLPYKTISEEYALEYGTDTLYMHEDAIKKGERVLIVDDLIATGGTALAMIKMVEKLEGIVVGSSFLIELKELNGRKEIEKYPVNVLIEY
ncbi:adenine phosphoribosyltransferase [Brachyspira hyodysenteriae]|uniref:Adenine phosphoribosyltransferase n=2 Tax=Brachyspira hyodysenteriae TaxID=159 RepID=APT_BRAHW|nr:adenine phosphoribosyltransferase [Brachyspira hyodysenteriae]C0QVL4.1 RecName: Full=Adenine phosphoribosyltransferase; Short=APRT [Brachyspira hyodysenteriae WA1]ACN84515.1 adenine phosphoribosyltransferase [Brachyspira hyodysenteriae WA1]ANN63405.1 adenine phosphoribosyltransferase [Brachyspira hyodysenteriae ATCC 27164]AUJ50248.1 adenine phosphoribosyltransferase [Brachyspira hyodysenteriae]KLI17143.1 adenine phosphoribosyltransferase [Brachyspira hyodysenteriae]KLI19016.1 adenine phosp